MLSLESNSISGPLPPGMCETMTSLRAVNLRDNHLTGDMSQLGHCALVVLDVSDNLLVGPVRVWEEEGEEDEEGVTSRGAGRGV